MVILWPRTLRKGGGPPLPGDGDGVDHCIVIGVVPVEMGMVPMEIGVPMTTGPGHAGQLPPQSTPVSSPF